ncbi:uncharacterized protein LOC135115268 isoform X2 [Scylla paramamosain]
MAAAVVTVGKCYPEKLLDNEGPTIPPRYQYNYAVDDSAQGTSFSHQEARENDLTQGNYEVQLPDGRLQRVSYKADKNGFVAEVKYEGEVLVQGPPGPQQSSPSFNAPLSNVNRPLPLENDFNPRAPQQEQFFPNQQEQFFRTQELNQFEAIPVLSSGQFVNLEQSQPQEIHQPNSFQPLLASPQQPLSFSPPSSFKPAQPIVSRLHPQPSFRHSGNF